MKKLLISLLAASLLASCTQIKTTSAGAVGVQRKQYALSFISSKQIEGMAAKSYVSTLNEAEKKSQLNPDPRQTERVRGIANRLIAQTVVFRPDALNWKWEVNVQQSKDINAYCMPGGKIMVYTGLIDSLNVSDDELAAVMGHEMSHALREHGREQQSEQIMTKVGLVGLALALASNKNTQNGAGTVMQGAALGSAVFISLPHSRIDEQEADEIGLELAARAGYNPEAAITLWEKMSKSGGKKPPEYLSTHPTDAKRIADMRRLLPVVTPLYEATKTKPS
ncbi:MAG TPA: M48 family metallopeptidase [Methylophilaceae bacterium]